VSRTGDDYPAKPPRRLNTVEDTTIITYGGDFVQPVETDARRPSNGTEEATRYVGGDVPQWVPNVVTSEPDLAAAGTSE
jgi:hypothetical protein